MKKESFILYLEQVEIFNSLTDKQAGELIKAIFKYEKEREIPKMSNTVKVAFVPIKQILDKNYEKYIEKCNQNKMNGLKGGRPKAKESENNPTKANGYFQNPKKADNDYDNDYDLIDDYKDINIFNYLKELEQKYPQQKTQIAFYKNCLEEMVVSRGLKDIVLNIDIETLSKAWEKINKQPNVINPQDYFIEILKNEVEYGRIKN